jgi:hypothetical protein
VASLRRPEARTESVEDLVAAVLRGEVRIPVFQRGLTWQAKEVVELFDSVYRGFPIGSLLFRRGPAEASTLQVGPLTVAAGELRDALWVVDGQQRLTSLAVGLGRHDILAHPPFGDDPYAVYFDAEKESFHPPPRDGVAPSVWVPVPALLDGGALTEWVFGWQHGQNATLRGTVFEAGRRLREYKASVYVMETDDEQTLRDIFYRVNQAGKPLTWPVVHDALYGHKGGAPSSLPELAAGLERLGMGRPDEESQLLLALEAFRGLDVTRSFGDHLRDDPRVLEGVVEQAAPTLRAVLDFLRRRAEIPHLRLLPYSTPLIVLARFFAKHPEPNERTRALLVRWIWRSFLSPIFEEKTLRRRGVAAIGSDEEASVQALLGLVGAQPARSLEIPGRFDARTAQSRLAMLALVSLRPQLFALSRQQLRTGDIDVAPLIVGADKDAFRPIFPLAGSAASHAANRMLYAGAGPAARELVAFIGAFGGDHAFLRSHAIDAATAAALVADDVEHFVAARAAVMGGALESLTERLAGWGRGDRPSIDYILAQAEG